MIKEAQHRALKMRRLSVSTSPAPVPQTSAERHTGRQLADLLVKEGYLSLEQLTYARKVQAKLATPKTLLHVLQELQFITKEQLRHTLQEHHVSIRLGDLLVELGYLREAELEAALSLQQAAQPPRQLGEVLIEAHFIEEHQLVEVLSYQLGFPYVEPNFTELDRDLLARVAPEWLMAHQCIPVGRQQGQIMVAFADPLCQQTHQAATQVFGLDLIVAIATQKAITEAIERHTHGPLASETGPNEDTATQLVKALIDEALQDRITDIHIEPLTDRLRIRFRRDGVLIPYQDFHKDLTTAITNHCKVLAQVDTSEKRHHQDGRIWYEDKQSGTSIDLRVSFYVTIHGEKIVLRLSHKKSDLLTLDEIGMAPKMYQRLCNDGLDMPTGIVLITGPSGAGKTTTLYSCIHYLNKIETSIITAEDPVEYVIDGVAQCSMHSKFNGTFEETLRHIVRQDPDVIVLGEIDERFTAETAIQAALTGRKILTTFHTEDSIGCLLRLLNMDLEAFLIASTISAVVAQRLLRKVCHNCAEPYVPTSGELQRLGYSSYDAKGTQARIGRGCTQCRFTGYDGRIGVYELLILDERVKEALLARQTAAEIRRISLESSGLATLLEDGICKAAQGITSFKEVIRHLPRLGKPRPLRDLQRLLGE